MLFPIALMVHPFCCALFLVIFVTLPSNVLLFIAIFTFQLFIFLFNFSHFSQIHFAVPMLRPFLLALFAWWVSSVTTHIALFSKQTEPEGTSYAAFIHLLVRPYLYARQGTFKGKQETIWRWNISCFLAPRTDSSSGRQEVHKGATVLCPPKTLTNMGRSHRATHWTSPLPLLPKEMWPLIFFSDHSGFIRFAPCVHIKMTLLIYLYISCHYNNSSTLLLHIHYNISHKSSKGRDVHNEIAS